MSYNYQLLRALCKKETDCCILWPNGTDTGGYPAIRIGATKHSGHRLVYEWCNGEIPAGLSVLHSCDNPKCVNPRHLSVGTQKENLKQMLTRGRADCLRRRGDLHPLAELTWEAVREIRASTLNRKELAIKFGISVTHVGAIQRNEKWKEVKIG